MGAAFFVPCRDVVNKFFCRCPLDESTKRDMLECAFTTRRSKMVFELYFVMGVLAFAVIALALMAEHFIAARWLSQQNTIGKALKDFEKRHPHMCDKKGVFYCFFKRDTFTVPKIV
jgi:hypothetical protein